MMIIPNIFANGNCMFSVFLGKLDLYSDKNRRKTQKIKRKYMITPCQMEKIDI